MSLPDGDIPEAWILRNAAVRILNQAYTNLITAS